MRIPAQSHQKLPIFTKRAALTCSKILTVALCVKQMPAIRDFGLFMGLIVGSCWFTVFFTIPPALTLWHRYISKWEVLIYKMIFGKLNCTLGSGRSDLPGKYLIITYGYSRCLLLILLKDVVTYQAHRAGFCLLCFFHNQDLDRFEIQTIKISG